MARRRTTGVEVSFDGDGKVVVPEGWTTGKFPRGLGMFKVDDGLFPDLVGAHEAAKAGASEKMGWAGGADPADPKWRVFGFSRGGRRALDDAGVKLHALETPVADVAEEIRHSAASCVDLDLDALIPELASFVARVEAAVDVQLDPLVAVQPNVHAGAPTLPPHLDWPLHDGFGKVIVTIPVVQDHNAVVVLVDLETSTEFFFDLPPRHAYVLANDVRNIFLHGIFAFQDPHRESLNLRFGLHTYDDARASVYLPWGAADSLQTTTTTTTRDDDDH